MKLPLPDPVVARLLAASKGWDAYTSLNGGAVTGMGQTLHEVLKNYRWTARIWCADHPKVLLAAILPTPKGAVLVTGNYSGPEPHARNKSVRDSWTPSPALIGEQQLPALWCVRCRTARPPLDDVDELVASTTRRNVAI